MQQRFEGKQEPIITRVDPLATLDGPSAETMNFLNEVIGRYPKAISFAAGRPPNAHVPTADAPRWLERFIAHRAERTGTTIDQARVYVGQYSDTGGIIQDLVAKMLKAEGDGEIAPQKIMMANGFQEALLIHLIRLARRGGAIVALDPTYVGLQGGAMAAGVPLYAATSPGDRVEALSHALRRARADGHNAVAVYVIPDFDNPTGHRMSLAARRALLTLAETEDVLIFEDSAYRFFDYADAQLPSLLSLDTLGRVVHLGTFSKMFFPGVRIGFAATKSNDPRLMAEAIAIKSFTSVATSPIAQAITGGFLLEAEFQVSQWNATRRDFCAANRDALDDALTRHLGDVGLRWTKPEGGFFTVAELPFAIDETDATVMARDHGIIATPMSFFSPSGGARREIRFAFSNLVPETIDRGIERFAGYVR
ncbi:MAG: GntR family transcriptional regulator, partial [Pseudomonadota bacterium]